MREIIDLPAHFENEFIRIKYLREKNILKRFGKVLVKTKKLKLSKTNYQR